MRQSSNPKRHDLTLARTGRKAIVPRPCTPQGPMEARGKIINVSSGPSKEIAGLKKMMTPGSQDLRVREFLHEALKVRRGPLDLCLWSVLVSF